MVDPSLVTEHSIWSMITGSGPVVQGVLILLIILSIWSWAITIAKCIHFRRAWLDSEEFSALFWETRNLGRVGDSTKRLQASPLVAVFSNGYRELSQVLHGRGGNMPEMVPTHRPHVLEGTELKSVEQALRRAELEETARLERGLTFLASVASGAPFVGLFGTVWGIMNAFHGLSSAKSTTLQAVAPGISEALVATAIGLAAAIPAAVAFNYLTVGIRRFRQVMDRFTEEFLHVAQVYSARGAQ